jgi:hypothetical protein
MMPVMAAISGIEPAVGMHHTPPREEKGGRAAADFGAAVTHRDMVQERLRVDPAALVDKQRAARALRGDDEPRRQKLRDERLANQEAEFERRRAAKGRLLDSKV